MKTNIHFWSYLAQFFLEWKMFQTRVVHRIKTHILWSMFFFLRKLCSLWDDVENIVERGRPRMTIWRKNIAFWIPKATNTHSEYVILTAFPLQQWLHEAPQCYVIRTRSLLFYVTHAVHILIFSTSTNKYTKWNKIKYKSYNKSMTNIKFLHVSAPGCLL